MQELKCLCLQDDDSNADTDDEDDASEGWDTDETGTDITHESDNEMAAEPVEGKKDK
jgi:hypothetical protein